MDEPATDVYEVILEDTGIGRSAVARFFEMIGNLLSARRGAMVPGGVIISVRRIDSRDELFRHIEDGGEDHMLADINNDLATMTAAEFKAFWSS